MKKYFFTCIAILIHGLLHCQSYSSCGVEASYTYTSVGNTATFINTSTSQYSNVSILSHYWIFEDGTQSIEDSPTHTFQNICNSNVCLVLTADSAGYGSEWCGYISHCESVDLGIVPLTLSLSSNYNAQLQVWEITSTTVGGAAPYSYLWTVDGQSVSSNLSTLTLNSIAGLATSVALCVVDANGCQVCSSLYVENPNVICTITLNSTLTDNLLLLEPIMELENESVDEWMSTVIINGDSVASLYGSQNYLNYLTELGTYEVCLSPSDWTLNAYPNCPSSICETVEVLQLASDCNAQFNYSHSEYQYYLVNTSIGFYDQLSWDFGNGVVYNDINDISLILEAGFHNISLTVTNSITNCTSTYTNIIEVPMPAHVCGSIFNDENQNGIFEIQELILDTVLMVWNNIVIDVYNGVFDQMVYPGTGCLYINGFESGSLITTTLGLVACDDNGLQLELSPGQEWCPIQLGIYITMSTICGTFYNDSNGNQLLDNNEVGLPYYEIIVYSELNGYYSIFTDASGNYCLEVPAMEFFHLFPQYPQNINEPISPPYYSNSSLGEGAYNNINFGVNDASGSLDLTAAVSGSGNLTPGFGITYSVIAQNLSDLESTAEVILTYNQNQTNVSAFPEGVVNPNNQTITWTINLGPYQSINLNATFTNATNMTLGELVTIAVAISATGMNSDNITLNNSDEFSQVVVGSFDPNNKLVEPIGTGDEGKIMPSTEEFTYTINFQNTGTAEAVNILISDLIDTDLIPQTIELVGSSHNVQMEVIGHQISWHFLNIMLPDSGSNEPASHGFVIYRIKPNTNLADGTVINNTANIFFDFNEAIVTKTTINTIDFASNTTELDAVDYIQIFPNPIHDIVSLKLEEDFTLNIYDAMGKKINSLALKQGQNLLSTANWTAGIYYFTFNNANYFITKRVLKD